MFCQSCGEQNTEAARFCNMCGKPLAKPGEAGGLLADAGSTVEDQPRRTGYAPGGGDSGYGGESMLSVSLAGIGVRSNKKTWVVISLIAVALIGIGAALSWWLGGNEEVVADAGHADPDDPFVIGSPLPVGADLPEDDGEPSTGASTRMGSTGMSTSMTASDTASMSASGSMDTAMSGSGSTGSASTGSGSTGSGSTGSGSTGSGSTGSGSSMAGSTGSDTTTAEMTADVSMGSGSDTTMESTMSTSTMTPDLSDDPGERDIAMDLYSSQVRFVIRRYYARRAQTCFDLATRNSPTVSGTVVIAMTIGADGAVSETRVARNTTGNATLGQCLAGQVQTWRLPAPPGGSLDMQMPFSR